MPWRSRRCAGTGIDRENWSTRSLSKKPAQRGSHHIYTHPKIPRALPLQPVNGEAKPYQLRQLAKLVAEYNLLEDADS